jgi:hypothetical protein
MESVISVSVGTFGRAGVCGWASSGREQCRREFHATAIFGAEVRRITAYARRDESARTLIAPT